MAINFPNNPAVNDTFTVGGTTFTFTGVKWETSAVVEISSDTTPSLGGNLDAATHNINNVGVITATTFSGNLTGNVTGTATTATVATNAQGLTGDPSIQVTNATVLGNLDVQGTTTTIDTAITEVDSLNVEGSVGIGTTNPGTKLEVHSDTIPRINTVFQGSKHFGMSVGGSGCGFVLTDGHFMTVTHQPYADRGTDNNLTERLRITSDANMGLGVTPVYSGVFGGSQRVLHIGGTTAPGLRIQSSTSNQGDFIIQAGNSGGATYLSNLSNNADTIFYTTSGGSIAEKMRIRAGGMITTPDQPAFNAKLSAATGQNFNGILVFNTVQYNIGSHYNGTNGRFTAPVDGRYLFNWYTNVDTNSNTTSLWGDWLINGNYSGFRFYTYVSHGGWEMLTASIIFDLNTNDYVNVFVSTSGNYDGGQYGSFNGCLLG